MTLHLIKGHFSKTEAISILTKMIDAKIKFQEDKIKTSDNEEDVKMRETRIKQLQKELFDARLYIDHQKKYISIDAEINLSA